MKKMGLLSIAMVLVIAVGLAYGDDGRIPKQIKDELALKGVTANYFIWFPAVPEISETNWNNILILSNFYNEPVDIYCYYTTYSQEQTMKQYTLQFYQKKLITLKKAGFGDDLYDIFCASNNFFGAEALLLEGGKIAAAWPPIF